MAKNIAIDIHAHAIIEEVETLVRQHPSFAEEARKGAAIAGAASLQHNRKLLNDGWLHRLTSLDARIAAMDAMRIDVQAVSVAPTQYYYWADRELAEKIVAIANERIAELCAHAQGRLVGLGTISLQHPELAIAQLERAIRELGLKGVIVSTAVNDAELADPRHLAFWKKAQELGALVFIHPIGCALGERLVPYYFSNVIGNPLETSIALAHLVFSGTLDRCPALKICAAHGGGYFPAYTPRFDHGWRVRPEAHTCERAPSEYLRRIWFDSLVYTPEQLAFLVQQAGASQVVLGTDYPFDMGIDNPLERLDAVASLAESDREAIRGLNALKLVRI